MNAERVEQPVPDHHGIPGKTLAAQREAMGWTVEQVADQLKLAVRQVEALEQGDYSSLPPPAVVRGFVRAYAKVVKLDAAPLVAQIALDSDAPDTSPTVVRRDKPTSFSQTRFPSNGKRPSKFPYGLVAVAVLLAGGAGAAWQFGLIPATLLGRAAPAASVATGPEGAVTVLPQPLQTQSVPSVGAAPADAKPADALPPVISNAVPLISVPPPSNPNAGMGAAPVVTTAPGVAPAQATPATPATPATAAAPNALILSVRENSWIEVRPLKKGRPLFSGMVKAGTIETITVAEPATLIVGNPGAVDATLRGKIVPLAAMPGGRVARIPLQ
jgi:cytoskeleton protein RodZ